MRRIAVVGPPGSGKTCLANELHGLLGFEVYHLDALRWDGKATRSLSEWETIHRRLISTESWIIDGDFGATPDLRRAFLRAADTIVVLDLPPLLCLRRTIRRSIVKPGMSKPYVLLRWAWTYRRVHRQQVMNHVASPLERQRILVLRRPEETASWLQQLASKTTKEHPLLP